MQLGFSPFGVAFLLMLFAPNVRWARNQPPGYGELQSHESRPLLVLERVGQVLSTCSAVAFTCSRGYSFPWLLILAAAFALMVLYEVAWVRYFRGGETLAGMYQPLGPVPVPIASLPVAALALLGVWCQSPVTLASAIILGVGHIGIHLGHLHELASR
jgi:hypothetical protein